MIVNYIDSNKKQARMNAKRIQRISNDKCFVFGENVKVMFWSQIISVEEGIDNQ